MQYDNSTLTITSIGTPDPFVTLFRGRYYLTFTAGNRVEIWSSRSLADIESSADRHVIWTPPQGTDHSADLWAPELHALHGRWYVYYAAANPAHGNKSHRMYVLGGPPASEDPCRGQWEFLGRINEMPDHWAIDGTVFEMNGHLYFVYSGWPLDNPDDSSDLIQQLYIMKLEDPTSAASPAIVISRPQHPWEITREGNGTDHGINEGPQFLSSPDGGISWQGLVYSCAGSWTHEYKMGLLQYIGGDPLDPTSWRKGEEPLVQTRRHGTGPFGPGHGSFLNIGGQVVAIYHATDSPTDGWENRRARAQRVAFTDEGPYMGRSFGMEPPRPESGSLVRRLKQKLGMSGRGKQELASEKSLKTLLGNRATYT
ncbi:Extracellular exo-alpha-(1-_5)-L-arabinofuranosidase [Daldinia childiae]|uniref:Extracellular exo-alpha-(1->5)-L-arabinofuranosidase n=1 Tax=Daldinia childiae TaxID=326645 RepID=UPI001444F7AE|nr:Extracellular exo-alpha-(1->5)-L-arabinofuranosidase [Daldinia childiae]KAF3057396.1 Extracellular exo-alpha-(1->5)-L-arabinofuranosidase [Daldinia childiae]